MRHLGPFRIEPARSEADLEAVTGLFAIYVSTLGVDLTFQDVKSEMENIPGKYAPPKGELWLARNGAGTPVACIGLRPLDDEGCCEIKRLYVSPLARGAGLGKALIDTVIAKAASLGYERIRLDTLPSMASARALYKNAGFMEIEPYYETPLVGTIFLELML